MPGTRILISAALVLLTACAGVRPPPPDRGPFEAYPACILGPVFPGTVETSTEERLSLDSATPSRIDGYRAALVYRPLHAGSEVRIGELRIEQFDAATWTRDKERLRRQALSKTPFHPVAWRNGPQTRIEPAADSLPGPERESGLFAVYRDSTRREVRALIAGPREASEALKGFPALRVDLLEWRPGADLEFTGVERDSTAARGEAGIYLLFSDSSRRAFTAFLEAPDRAHAPEDYDRLRDALLQRLRSCVEFLDSPPASDPQGS